MKNLLLSLMAIFPLFLSAQSFEKAMEYYNNDQDSLALEEFLKCEPSYKAKYGELDTVYYSKILYRLGNLYNSSYKNDTAIMYLKDALAVYQSKNNEGSIYPKILNCLGNVYFEQSDYDQALFYYNKQVNVYENQGLKQTEDYATLRCSIASIYSELGDGNQALEYFNESMTILEALGLEDSESYAAIFSGLGTIYLYSGNYKRSLGYFKRVALINDQLGLHETPSYSTAIHDVGLVYLYMGKNDYALEYFNKSAEIDKKLGLEQTSGFSVILNNIGLANIYMGNYVQAVECLKKATNLKKDLGLSITRSNAITIRNIGYAYYELANYNQALEYYKKSAAIDAKIGMKESSIFQEIGRVNHILGNYDEALVYFNRYNKLTKDNLYNSDGVFPISTQLEQIRSTYSGFSRLFAYTYSYPSSFSIDIYNIWLLIQSRNNSSINNKMRTIAQSNNAAIQQQLKQYKQCQQHIYDHSVGNISLDSTELNTLHINMYKAEEYMSAHTHLSFNKKILSIEFKDVEESLKPDEATIGFVQYWLSDSACFQYAAFVVRPEFEYPHMIKLCTNLELERLIAKTNKETAEASPTGKIDINEYIQNLYTNNDTSLYSLVWEPLDSLLLDAKKVYLSPSGELYNFAFDALPISSNQYLSDKYEIEYVSSSAQIVIKPEPLYFTDSSSIALFGDMDYSMDTSAIKNQTLAYATTRGEENVNMEHVGTWLTLDNAEEIASINNVFSKKNTPTRVYTKDQAIEEAFTNLDGQAPEIIHLSTHAKYNALEEKKDILSDSVWYETSENPLLRSYLAMSGANTLDKIKNTKINDGKLTAYEVANMDLTNTRLASLAACQTGLGDIGNYEGVQGLRHAFKIAGVDYLLLSLWSVPDKQTSELMLAFYKNFVNKNMEVREAFRAAQGTMKNKYENPYFWAGFVLVN